MLLDKVLILRLEVSEKRKQKVEKHTGNLSP